MSKYSCSQKNSVQIVNKLGYVFGFCCHVINNKYIFNICQSNMYLFYSFQMWQSQQVYFWLNSSTRVLVSDLLNKFLECIFSFFKLLNGIFKRFKNALQLAAKCTDINLKEQWKRQEYCFLRRRETTNYSERLNSCCKISYNCTAKLPTWSKKKKILEDKIGFIQWLYREIQGMCRTETLASNLPTGQWSQVWDKT